MTEQVVVGGTRTIAAPTAPGTRSSLGLTEAALSTTSQLGATPMTVTATYNRPAARPTRYVSDMTWGTVTNGWGPPNGTGPTASKATPTAGPIRVAGTTYPKGVGAHANSTIPVDLTGLNCTRFQSVIGIDDEVANQGTVRFQVWNGTTTMLTQSAVITGASATATIDIDITGINNLRLVVTDNGDGNGYDHADWADAKLTCARHRRHDPADSGVDDTANGRQESASPSRPSPRSPNR